MRRALLAGLVACASHATEPPVPVAPSVPSDAAPAIPGPRLTDDATPLGYDVRLEVDPDRATFRGEVRVRVRLAKPLAIAWLHAAALTIERATWSRGAETGVLTPSGTSGELRGWAFGRQMPPGDLELVFAYAGVVGERAEVQEALFRQHTSDGWFLYTQAESVFARRVVPCFDEPRWKVPWRVTLVVPADDVALANAAEIAREPLADGRVAVHFAETPPMASYVFAIAVGRFAVVDGGVLGKQRVPFRVVVAPADKKLAALAVAIVPPMVAMLEAYFDSPLPWPKLDFVAVPHLFGAMENPGLVTFDRQILVGHVADPFETRQLARVAGHELAHLWFGDWVTFAWWNDLWLAESFASWMGDKAAAATGAFPDQALERMLDRQRALAADDAIGARSLDRPIASGREVETEFDAISYEKGQAVLAMFEHFVGEPAFRAAIRAYLGAHATGNATSADLFAAVARATSPPVARALATFVSSAGAPILDVRCDGGALVAQARGGVTIPACTRERCQLVGATPVSLAPTCAPRVANADGLGYYHVAVDPALLPARAQLGPGERVARGDDVAAATIRGELAPARALAELHALANGAGSAADVAHGQIGAIAIATALDPLVDDAHRAAWAARLGRDLATVDLRVRSGPANRAARVAREGVLALGATLPAASYAAGRRELATALARPDGALVDVGAAGPLDVATRAAIARVLAATDARDREEVLAAVVDGPEELVPAIVATALRAPVDLDTLVTLLARPRTRTVAWRALAPHLGELATATAPADFLDLVEAVGARCDAAAHVEVQAALAPIVATMTEGPRALATALATIDRCRARADRLGSDRLARLPD